MTDDPFDNVKTPSVSFKNAPIGATYTLEVLEAPALVQSRNFDSGKPDFWEDGNPKMSVVTKVTNKATGEELSLWAPKPSSLFAALTDARTAAGAPIEKGGTLTVTYIADKPNADPKKNAQKLYQATYVPPAAADPWGSPAAAPAAQPAPVAQQPVAQPAPAAAPAPGQPNPEQVAALVAAGVDVATVYPGYIAPQPVGAAPPF